MTIHIRFSAPQHLDGELVEQAALEADRILIDGDRLLFLLDGEVRADLAAAAVVEIDLAAQPAKAYSVQQIRADHPQAYKPWEPEEEQRLLQLYGTGTGIADIAEELGRKPGAIRARLRRLRPTV